MDLGRRLGGQSFKDTLGVARQVDGFAILVDTVDHGVHVVREVREASEQAVNSLTEGLKGAELVGDESEIHVDAESTAVELDDAGQAPAPRWTRIKEASEQADALTVEDADSTDDPFAGGDES